MSAVDEVRAFNRFYTHYVGALSGGLLDSSFSLTEVRVLYELAHRAGASSAELCTVLGLDAGYASRILQRFQKLGVVTKKASATDARRSELRLTAKGKKEFDALDARAREQVVEALAPLAHPQRRRLLSAMSTIRTLLGTDIEPAPLHEPYLLRQPNPGDLGWVVQRHGALYAEEYTWNVEFEALVASVVAEFAKKHDPERERCWIAERNGEPVGSVFLVAGEKKTAKLRLLLVEPHARGFGIGERLVAECIRFARHAGYRKITLWTNDVLVSARKIYEAAGFSLAEQKPHRSFGHRLVAQTWELEL